MPARRRTALLSALAIVLLAFALRLTLIDAQSLWSDEGNSAALATRSLERIAADAAQDIHPPLYYWLLHGWSTVFGYSELALRTLSALLATLLVAIGYAIADRVYGRPTALVTALLVAVNPFQIHYAQEARMYMLVASLGAALVLTLLRLVTREESSPTGGGSKGLLLGGLYLVFATAGLYAHYTFAVLLIAVNVVCLLWIAAGAGGRLWRRRLVHWMILQLLVLMAFIPWMRIALTKIEGWPSVAQPFGWSRAWVESFSQFSFGHVRDPRTPLWILPFAVLFLVGAVLPPRRKPTASGPSLPPWFGQLLSLVWLLLPVAAMFAGGLFKEAYLKFLLVSSLPFCMLLAHALTAPCHAAQRYVSAVSANTVRRRPQAVRVLHWLAILLSTLCGLAVLISSALSLRSYYTDPAQARDDYRNIAAFVQATADPRDAVILNAPGQSEVWEYYDRSGIPVYPLPEQRPPDVSKTVSALQDLSERHRYLYCVFWATDESDPGRIVETWLDHNAFKAVDTWRGDVRFVTYATKAPGSLSPMMPEQEVRFGKSIQLGQIGLSDMEVTPGEILQVRLSWNVLEALQQRYKVTLQLLSASGQVIAQRDAEPEGETRPTSEWQAGELIEDLHGLFIPLATPPGTYRLIVALYDIEDGSRLPLADGSDHLVLHSVEITRPPTWPAVSVLPISNRKSLDLGDITLLGHNQYKRGYSHDPEAELRPGDLLHLSMYWRADSPPDRDWTMILSLGSGLAELKTDLVSVEYGTSRWNVGEIVRGDHDLLLPPSIAPGRYILQLSLASPGGAMSDPVRLGPVRIL